MKIGNYWKWKCDFEIESKFEIELKINSKFVSAPKHQQWQPPLIL